MDAKGQLKRVTREIAASLSDDVDVGTDVLKTLKKEHTEVKAMLADLVDCEDARQRRTLVQKIKHALVPHTKAEEKVVYDAIIALKDEEPQTNGHEGYVEHELAARTLKQLDGIAEANSPEHKATAKVLKELVEHHIKEEESNVWADVRANFSREDRERMNMAFEKAKSQVKVPP